MPHERSCDVTRVFVYIGVTGLGLGKGWTDGWKGEQCQLVAFPLNPSRVNNKERARRGWMMPASEKT